MLCRLVFKIIFVCFCLQGSDGFAVLRLMMDCAEEGEIEELEYICLTKNVRPSKAVWLAAARQSQLSVLRWGWVNDLIPLHLWHPIHNALLLHLRIDSLNYYIHLNIFDGPILETDPSLY